MDALLNYRPQSLYLLILCQKSYLNECPENAKPIRLVNGITNVPIEGVIVHKMDLKTRATE